VKGIWKVARNKHLVRYKLVTQFYVLLTWTMVKGWFVCMKEQNWFISLIFVHIYLNCYCFSLRHEIEILLYGLYVH